MEKFRYFTIAIPAKEADQFKQQYPQAEETGDSYGPMWGPVDWMQEFWDKFGFSDGDAVPYNADSVRADLLSRLNAILPEDYVIVADDQYGSTHNPCMVQLLFKNHDVYYVYYPGHAKFDEVGEEYDSNIWWNAMQTLADEGWCAEYVR